MRQRGFALFEVLLAVVLMMIAAAASYTLVKSFRANSSVQQFIRYSTNITQSFMPFIDGNSYDNVLFGDKLSSSFLSSIGIPTEDQNCNRAFSGAGYCVVSSGMYSSDSTTQNFMNFAVQSDSSQNLASYFIIGVKATGSQVNQVLQSASSLFSVYCLPEDSALNTATTKCTLQSDAEVKKRGDSYSLFLVFPKSGNTAPDTALTPI